MYIMASESKFEYPYDDDSKIRSISAEMLEGAVQIHVRCKPGGEPEALRALADCCEILQTSIDGYLHS